MTAAAADEWMTKEGIRKGKKEEGLFFTSSLDATTTNAALFIIMLLDVQGRQSFGFSGITTFAGLMAFALLLTGLGTIAVKGHLDAPRLNRLAAEGANLKPYAQQLFTTYLLPVQIIGFLLLIAMLGVIVLSKKHATEEPAK